MRAVLRVAARTSSRETVGDFGEDLLPCPVEREVRGVANVSFQAHNLRSCTRGYRCTIIDKWASGWELGKGQVRASEAKSQSVGTKMMFTGFLLGVGTDGRGSNSSVLYVV